MSGLFSWSSAPRVLIAGTLLALSLALLLVMPARAQSGAIVLDGQFDDWLGLPSVPDVQGDAQTNHSDLSAFYFTNNHDQDYLFFMAERWDAGSEGMELRLFIDTNNNGTYAEAADRLIELSYHPNQGGRTYVDLYDGQGAYINQIAYQTNWGEPGKGRRVEWGLNFTDLGIAPYQTIRMQLVSNHGTQLSDSVGEVQWSPANALGYWLLGLLTIAGLGWLYYQRRVTT
ncbi:MAG: hypothetical protein JSW42_11815 [Chloroflexota bacterium]|nr:MAG: hypothetical protein JSW42_11815 [Chloroflexota bacterium]